MMKLDESKLAKLSTASELFDMKYGKSGTEKREKFHEAAVSWYYGEILRNRRRELKLTQKDLADRVGVVRSYISRVENGASDIQMSNFFRIAEALGIQFTPTFSPI